MDKEYLIKRFYDFGDDFDKALYTEYLYFCNNMDDENFDNYLRKKELTESEFFALTDEMCRQKCYIMLSKLLNNNRGRLISPDVSRIRNMELREDIEKRFEKLMM